MKIISHPTLLRQKEEELFEKERMLEIEKCNLEISLMIIKEKERNISNRNRGLALLAGSTFLLGMAVGILIQ
jgi:hypothetical protein|tara:strand:- start:385 stop:600 length:216 start_codon:yes stop_codon:yes gene_type:complete